MSFFSALTAGWISGNRRNNRQMPEIAQNTGIVMEFKSPHSDHREKPSNC